MTIVLPVRERVPLGAAQVLAWRVLGQLRPFCDRIEVAGSIRRRAETVKDVELLCIPKPVKDLFDNAVGDRLTDYLAEQVMAEQSPWRRRAGIDGRTVFGQQNKFLVYEGFPVDVFSSSADNWGRDLMVRTGPKDWNIRFMQRFQERGWQGHAYGPAAVTLPDGSARTAPDEETMFELLGWPLTAPELRQ